MLRVGLTGGIGSGKSAVSRIFRELGVAVIDTDELAREVVKPASPGLAAVVEEFGPSLLQADGSLDRSALRNLVFSDPAKRRSLEQILHPLIRQCLHHQLEQINAPYVIIVIPLLIEKGWQSEIDRILVVDCPEELQLQRTVARDSSSEALISQIMQSQVSRQDRLAEADDIIHNDADLSALHLQTEKIHQYYSELAQSY